MTEWQRERWFNVCKHESTLLYIDIYTYIYVSMYVCIINEVYIQMAPTNQQKQEKNKKELLGFTQYVASQTSDSIYLIKDPKNCIFYTFDNSLEWERVCIL